MVFVLVWVWVGGQSIAEILVEWRIKTSSLPLNFSLIRDSSGEESLRHEGICGIQVPFLNQLQAERPQQTQMCPSQRTCSSHGCLSQCRQKYIPGPWNAWADVAVHFFPYPFMHTFGTLTESDYTPEIVLYGVSGKKRKYQLLNILIHLLDATPVFYAVDLEK